MLYEEIVVWTEPTLTSQKPRIRIIDGMFYSWLWGQDMNGEWDCCAMIAPRKADGFEMISARSMPIATLAQLPAIPPRPVVRRLNPYCG